MFWIIKREERFWNFWGYCNFKTKTLNKRIWCWLSPSREIDQRIPQFNWTRDRSSHNQTKAVVSNTIFPWWLSLCKKSKILIETFQRIWQSKNPAIWLVESILAHNWAIFFWGMQLSQKHKGHCYAPFLGYKTTQRMKFLAKAKKILEHFWAFSLQREFSWKIQLLQFVILETLQLHVKFEKNPMRRSWENVLTGILTNWPADSGMGSSLPKYRGSIV